MTPRLVRLHLASRRVPPAAVLLAAAAAAVAAVGQHRWGDAVAGRQLPLAIECGAAAVVASTTGSPFGEVEHATGRLRPLRLATVTGLAALAVAVLAAAAAGSPGGCIAALRNTAGLTGLALGAAAALGAPLSWIGPLLYLPIAEYALGQGWQTPWTWPARLPYDRGAALCAAAALVAGVAAFSVLGPDHRVGPDS